MLQIQTNTPLRKPPADYCPPGSDRIFTLQSGYDAGKKMFYSDHLTGDGSPEATIVFVHGNPECSYTYRHIRDQLLKSPRCLRLVAMDHIGFGLSDQADYEMVDFHHAANVLQLVRHLDLQNVTLVVHDWGGPIGIGAFMEDAWRVTRLLVMNTTIFPMPATGITYTNYPVAWLPWSSTPYIIPDALWGGIAAYVVSHAAPQSTARFLFNSVKYALRHGLRRLPPGTPEYVWAEQFRTKANSRSSQRNVLQTPVWGFGYQYNDPVHGPQDSYEWYQRLHVEIPAEWGEAGRNIPVCGFFGQWDACGKDEVIAQWHTALPNMQNSTWKYADVGHFIEEYKGPQMAEAILGMLDLPSEDPAMS